MSIHIILGRPGSGKSMYATSRVLTELVEGQRNIVTNLPLRPDKLNEYAQTKYPTVNTRFVERLRILSDDEMRAFWKFRGPQLSDEKPFGDDEGRGVAYFLDEAHIAFNARDWATLGRDAIHYMSQHRKLGDVVWPITQAVGNLDKQFRSVAEDYTVLRNEYTAKMGIFRGMGRFVRKSYYTEPQGKVEPFETATFQIDTAGIASCYDTAKGIGVHGSKADIGKRARGIPIWTIFPAFIALALSAVYLPMMAGKGAQKFLTGDTAKKVEEMSKAIPGTTPQAAKQVPTAEPTKTALQGQEKPKGPEVSGYMVRGNTILVTMADGTVLDETDGRVTEISRKGKVKVDGLWVRPQKPPREAGNFLQDFNKTKLDKWDAPVTVGASTSSDVGTQQKPKTTEENENPKHETPERGHDWNRPDPRQTKPVKYPVSIERTGNAAGSKADGHPPGFQKPLRRPETGTGPNGNRTRGEVSRNRQPSRSP